MLPILPALCLMPAGTNFASYYAGILGSGLHESQTIHVCMTLGLGLGSLWNNAYGSDILPHKEPLVRPCKLFLRPACIFRVELIMWPSCDKHMAAKAIDSSLKIAVRKVRAQ